MIYIHCFHWIISELPNVNDQETYDVYMKKMNEKSSMFYNISKYVISHYDVTMYYVIFFFCEKISG